ncbi:Protein of unknown function [Gryllus bimaculatus]|nr:Protein of unknown function [Gryllus bimaculatus]
MDQKNVSSYNSIQIGKSCSRAKEERAVVAGTTALSLGIDSIAAAGRMRRSYVVRPRKKLACNTGRRTRREATCAGRDLTPATGRWGQPGGFRSRRTHPLPSYQPVSRTPYPHFCLFAYFPISLNPLSA